MLVGSGPAALPGAWTPPEARESSGPTSSALKTAPWSGATAGNSGRDLSGRGNRGEETDGVSPSESEGFRQAATAVDLWGAQENSGVVADSERQATVELVVEGGEKQNTERDACGGMGGGGRAETLAVRLCWLL